jgi:hypothetical protein
MLPHSRSQSRITVLCLFTLLLLVAATAGWAAPPKPKWDTPTVSCAGSTEAAIDVMVCAGGTGAPAGFSLQWITEAQYNSSGWPLSDSLDLCKASFSGNANDSAYNLGAFQCVTVNIGANLFDDPGASTNCPDPLTCGTTYVFRSFAHANSSRQRSDFSGNTTCSTDACESCTLTQGYWKNHNDTVCELDPASPLCVAWPATILSLGNVSYTQAELLAIFNKPAAGNGLISLAHQLIAAKLNFANGAGCDEVAGAIAAADALIGNLVVPPVGTGSLANSATSALTGALSAYNEGETEGCADHCE